MSKMEEFKANVLKAYKEIHGEHGVVGDEHAMMFHYTQRPWEFFGAWKIIEDHLPDSKELSFLEIGAAKGLWSIAFIEFCKLYDRDPVYVTVSYIEHSSLQQHEIEWNRTLINVKNYYEGQCKEWILFDENSQSILTRDMVAAVRPQYNFTLIDAEHTYHAVLKDTALYEPLTKNLLIYHDIVYDDTIGQAIRDSNIKLDYEIKIPTPTTGEGIGIHVIRR